MKNITTHLTNLFRYGERIEPTRDWFVLLALFGMLFVVSAVWNAWLFNRVASGGTLSAAATSTPTTFSKASLDVVERLFEERAAEELKYTSGEYSFTDPSK